MKKILKKWWWWILAGIIILGLGLGLRLYQLTLLPVFVDEAIYIRWAQVMKAESTLRFLPLSDGKQPLFMWLVIPFLKFISDPLFAGRIVSVFSGMLTLVGIFLLSYQLFKSRKVALISSFLYAISPYAVFFDRMALADSLLSMFGIWTLLLGMLAVRKLRLDYAMLTGFALGGALLTKSPALFFSILLPSVWTFSNYKKNKKIIFIHLVKLVCFTVAIYIIGYGLYNILRLGPNFHMIGLRNQDYIFPISHLWTNFKDPFIPHLKDFLLWIWTMGPSLLFAMMLLGIFVGFKKFFKETLLLLGWSFFPILVQSEFAKVFTARYIFFTLPYLFVLSGVMFATKSKLINKIAILIMVLIALQAVKFNFNLLTNPEKANLSRGERSGYLEEWTAGQGIKEVAEYLKLESAKDPGKQIVVGTEGYFGTLPDGLQMYLNDYPKIIVIGVGIDIRETPQSLTEALKAGNKTYFVINKSRFKGNADLQGFKLISGFPKPPRRLDSREYVTKGPQEILFFFQLEDINKSI
ncbi:MAG: glycosyltransferase family 39 protein [bacterium]|nr:glycosyltransferase family 39 protein [bacterium]